MSNQKGHLHPITTTIREIREIFAELGFGVADGPELETEFYNFDALNVPADHPARDMQDTFWLKPARTNADSTRNNAENTEKNAEGKIQRKSAWSPRESALLRTHTTSVTARYIEAHKDNLPVRVIAPGKVFRNEATDATHEAQFFQLDGVAVDKDISLAHLKGTLEYFFKKLLGNDTYLRFRPSYFPFVEPGVEIDIKFQGAWLEVMGAGLLHENVFKALGVDATKWRGFAFGGGIDRLVMLKYDIPDIRLLYSGDLRLVNQF